MARLEPRIARLEASMTEPDTREVVLLSSSNPDYGQQRAEALERGAFVIALVALTGQGEQQ